MPLACSNRKLGRLKEVLERWKHTQAKSAQGPHEFLHVREKINKNLCDVEELPRARQVRKGHPSISKKTSSTKKSLRRSKRKYTDTFNSNWVLNLCPYTL